MAIQEQKKKTIMFICSIATLKDNDYDVYLILFNKSNYKHNQKL